MYDVLSNNLVPLLISYIFDLGFTLFIYINIYEYFEKLNVIKRSFYMLVLPLIPVLNVVSALYFLYRYSAD
jgi:hypothetical protein